MVNRSCWHTRKGHTLNTSPSQSVDDSRGSSYLSPHLLRNQNVYRATGTAEGKRVAPYPLLPALVALTPLLPTRTTSTAHTKTGANLKDKKTRARLGGRMQKCSSLPRCRGILVSVVGCVILCPHCTCKKTKSRLRTSDTCKLFVLGMPPVQRCSRKTGRRCLRAV